METRTRELSYECLIFSFTPLELGGAAYTHEKFSDCYQRRVVGFEVSIPDAATKCALLSPHELRAYYAPVVETVPSPVKRAEIRADEFGRILGYSGGESVCVAAWHRRVADFIEAMTTSCRERASKG